jgi:hypothetical protein
MYRVFEDQFSSVQAQAKAMAIDLRISAHDDDLPSSSNFLQGLRWQLVTFILLISLLNCILCHPAL